MAISKDSVRWLIEATSSPENHKLGDWVLNTKSPLEIFLKFHPKLVYEWLIGFQREPRSDALSPWFADENLVKELKKSFRIGNLNKDGIAGGFGVTLPVEKTVTLHRREIKLLGQAKFYLGGWSSDFEAKAESVNLSHLNSRLIPKLYDLGMTSGSYKMPYVVMERIEGYDLTSSKRKLLSASEFKIMAMDTLRALKYAHSHEKRYFHTDIKPANIMFSELDGTYVIVDFGIARILKRETADGPVSGTQGYKAPEAYSEISAHKSDIYSLGLTFYYALTGKEPVIEAMQKLWEVKKFGGNKEDLILRDAEYQELINDLEIDFSGLRNDQAILLSRMLEPDYRVRSEVTELIGLASQLEIGDQVFEATTKDPWITLTKAMRGRLEQSGMENFRLLVRATKHGSLWIKVVEESTFTKLVCSRPKNPIGLSQLGWKNGAAGLMELRLPLNTDMDDLSDLITLALKYGLEIEPQFTYTFVQ